MIPTLFNSVQSSPFWNFPPLFLKIPFSLILLLQKKKKKGFCFPAANWWFCSLSLKIYTYSSIFNGDLASAVNHLLHVPETIEKAMFSSRSHDKSDNQRMERIPVDILETPKEYLFYMDVPGLSKSDIQVTLEDENTLVIKNSGKRKREDGEDEGCKYIRLERNSAPKFMRKFKLPEDSDINKVSAKCENGVLSVSVEKLPPPPKSKTVEVTIS